MYKVVKRDGTLAEFNISKISAAITKAFEALEKQYHPSVIDLLALKVTSDFEPKIKDGCIQVEDIQDSVEEVLSLAGYADVAKAYILYRKQREKVRNVKSSLLDYKKLVGDYLNVNDWRVKENSTVTYSVGGLILSNSGAITANYWLSEIYDEEIAEAHRSAAIHLHDLSMLTGYCAGWSLRQLIEEGLGGVPGKITSSPAKHLASCATRWSTFSASCRTSGRARRRSPPSTPTSRPSSRWTPELRPGQKVHRVVSSTASTPPAAGARRRPFPTSR